MMRDGAGGGEVGTLYCRTALRSADRWIAALRALLGILNKHSAINVGLGQIDRIIYFTSYCQQLTVTHEVQRHSRLITMRNTVASQITSSHFGSGGGED